MRTARAIPLLLLLILGPPTVSAALENVPASPQVATPHEAGFQALQARLRPAALFQENEKDAIHFVKDQMLGILVLLNRAATLPDELASQRAALRQSAVDVWVATEPAYDAASDYYWVTLASASQCADFAANAWGLRAALALHAHTRDTRYQTRADELSSLLVNLLSGGIHNGVRDCQRGIHPVPLALWALLERQAVRPDAAVANTIASKIAQLKLQNLDQAYRDATGFYSAATNAQMLLVLEIARTVLRDPGHAATRNQIANFLTARCVFTIDGDRWALGVTRTANGSYEATGDQGPINQWWVAYALHNQAQVQPGSVPPTLVQDLVGAVLPRYWSFTGRGIVGGFPPRGDGLVHFEENALAAYLLAGPVLAGGATNRESEVRLVVPQGASFTYPGPEASLADQYYVRNRWELRFGLATNATGTYHVVLPTQTLGPLNASFPESVYTPSPNLAVVGGERLPMELVGDPYPLIDLTATLNRGLTEFRLTTFAPVLPVASNLTEGARLVLRVHAGLPVELDNFYLDVDADQVALEGASLNDVSLPGASVFLEGPLTTEQLPLPHLRVQLKGLTLRPDRDNEILLAFKDVVSPTIGKVDMTADEAGEDPLVLDGDRYEISSQESNYVHARVRDNLALRHVALVASTSDDPGNATEVRMNPHPTEAGLFVGVLPKFGKTGEATLRVVAIDYHGNQQTSEPLALKVESPLLQGGNVILLVFAVTLFLTAVAIYVKMGRKGRTPRL